MNPKLTFMPFGGDPSNMPFKVDCEGDETFRDVVVRAIKMLGESDKEALNQGYDISTGSADIKVDTKYLDMHVDDVINQYGGVFSLKSGTEIKGPF
ncbi:MAG: hypothetical protein ACFFCS_10280 [Candidatus Hodarchaeota archaeon]